LDFTNLRSLDERDRGTVPHFDKTVKGIFHSVHPIERDEFHATHLREEIDLLFDVLRANSEVMNTVWQTHKKPPLGNELKLSVPYFAYLLIAALAAPYL
jgi:hypothetical protein